MKKLLGLVALVIAGCAVMSASAQAALPEWLSDGKPIPVGVVEPVGTSGTLTLTLRAATGAPISTIKCKVTDEEAIQNTIEGGADEMKEIGFFGCKAKPSPCPMETVTEIKALGLPWRSFLSAGPPVRDQFFGVALEVTCSGKTAIGVYTGTLTPEVGKSVLIFGAGSGTLSGSSGSFAEIRGKDKLKGPPGDTKITAS